MLCILSPSKFSWRSSRIHSETNLFRYDENITFATQELMPCIDSYRDAHARLEPYPDESVAPSLERNPFCPDWKKTVSVAYSFADGSAARSHAIQAALRPYRPTYFHFWQLKTFWHESKITDEDIEVHSFEEMETVPAMAVDQTPDTVIMVVNEMKAFRKDYIETLKSGGRNDVETFWLRKSKQPVLAVLLVEKPGGKYVLYRGTNMEVSMPTGSLCAERNVIGTALANDPGLKREDLRMVAVLSLQLPGNSATKCLPPPGPPFCQPVVSSARDGADFVKDVSDKLKQHQAHGAMRHVLSTSSFAGIAEERPSHSSDDWEMEVVQADHSGMSPLASPSLSVKHFAESSDLAEAALIPDLSLSHLLETCPSGIPCGDSTPKRRISLYRKKSLSNTGEDAKRQKVLMQPLQVRLVMILFVAPLLDIGYSILLLPLEYSFQDMNPLKPCGACNEWLKKIAQSNPHFKVLTFTDNQCNGVYISPCEE
jgi:cytidine deaminase